MVGAQTQGLGRRIEAATRFLDRVETLSAADRERIGTESFGTSEHTAAMFATADEVTTLRNQDREGQVGAFLVGLERRVDDMRLDPEVGNLVKAAAKAILVRDRPGMERVARQLYAPFETVVPLQSVVD